MGVAELLVVMGVFAIPVGLIGGLVAWGLQANKKRIAAWTAVAGKLGLHFASNQIYGTYQGQPVRLFVETRGSGKNRQSFTVSAGMLVPGFDLGLAIYKHGFFSSVGEWMGMSDIQIGDPAFDKAFVVKGDEVRRVQALLGHAGLRAALQQVLATNYVFSVRDAGFRVECRGVTSDPQWLEWALVTSAAVTQQLGEARTVVPCASTLAAHRDAWVQYAQATGMTGMDTPLCMSGRSEGRSISVYAVRTAALTYGVEVLLRFDVPLGRGLYVRPQGALDALGALFGGQDLEVGDAEFDKRFVVKATARDGLGDIFDSEVRAKMLDVLGRVGTVQVRDDGLTLRANQFSPDPASVPQLVAQARTLADRIADNVARLGMSAAGPYR